jgi:hypothetical protein
VTRASVCQSNEEKKSESVVNPIKLQQMTKFYNLRRVAQAIKQHFNTTFLRDHSDLNEKLICFSQKNLFQKGSFKF